jgi:hypothetical protein
VSTSADRLTLDTLDLYLASLRGASRGRRARPPSPGSTTVPAPHSPLAAGL